MSKFTIDDKRAEIQREIGMRKRFLNLADPLVIERLGILREIVEDYQPQGSLFERDGSGNVSTPPTRKEEAK